MPNLTSAVAGATTGAIVLAAGRGTRMGSDLPKVLHPLAGRPMILYIVDTLQDLGFGAGGSCLPIFVVGFGSDLVAETVDGSGQCILQADQLGTGDAAATGLATMPQEVDRILLIHGDEPLIAVETYREMLDVQLRTSAHVVLLTGKVEDTHGLGRVVRDGAGKIRGLVQESELDSFVHSNEINFGAYVFDRTFMESALRDLRPHAGGEYYLTDLVGIAVSAGYTVADVEVPFPDEQMGVNDLRQLERAERFVRERALIAQDQAG